ncbi:MAG: hypothetical protein WC476_01385 [Phycisphaerae bacterium]
MSRDLESWREANNTICLDFDGVIHKYSQGWQGGNLYDEPIDGAIESICELCQAGYKLVILTARCEKHNEILDWFKDEAAKRGLCNCRKVNCPEVTNIKPPARVYIDDRGIRFTNWNDILSYFL